MATLEELLAMAAQQPFGLPDPRNVRPDQNPLTAGSLGSVSNPMEFVPEQPLQMSPNAPGESFADRLGVGLASSMQGMPQPRGFWANLLASGAKAYSTNQLRDMEERSAQQKRIQEAARLMNEQRAKTGREMQAKRITALQQGSIEDKKLAQRERESLRRAAVDLKKQANDLRISLLSNDRIRDVERAKVQERRAAKGVDPLVQKQLSKADQQAKERLRTLRKELDTIQSELSLTSNKEKIARFQQRILDTEAKIEAVYRDWDSEYSRMLGGAQETPVEAPQAAPAGASLAPGIPVIRGGVPEPPASPAQTVAQELSSGGVTTPQALEEGLRRPVPGGNGMTYEQLYQSQGVDTTELRRVFNARLTQAPPRRNYFSPATASSTAR